MRQCKVFVHDVEAGLLQETDDRQYIFTYNNKYEGAPVCLAIPLLWNSSNDLSCLRN